MEILKNLKVTLDDLILVLEKTFKVETKDAQVIPFILNNKQNQLVKAIKDAPTPKRILILKGRQFGFSTLIVALFLLKCLLVHNTRAVVISRTEDATKKLFRKVSFFLRNLPLPANVGKESEKEFTFPGTNSYFYIGTAGQRTFGRGDNITDLHCSEVAFWENAGTIMTGLIQAVGMTGNVYIETTANGMGNYFHRLWVKSWQVKDAAWKAVFFSWTDFAEYELPVPDDFRPTSEEEEISERHPELTNRKLAWRRWKIQETETDGGMSAEDLFRQEYPLDPSEAFIASGRPVFNQLALLAYTPEAGTRADNLTIFESPERGKSYFLGVDVAEGIEGGDYSVIEVLDNAGRQVAEWRGLIDPDQLATEAKRLGEYYFEAVIGVEVNNQGRSTIDHLKKIYPIHKLYHREVLDENFRTMTKKVGWLTNEPSRNLMIADMMAMVRTHGLVIRSQKLIDECLSFVRNKQGKPEAQPGCNDDTVMATAIAIQMLKAFPYLVAKPPSVSAKSDAEERFNKKMKALKQKQFNRRYANKPY